MEGAGATLFLGGRPRRFGAGAGTAGGAGVGVSAAVLFLPAARRGVASGAGVKSSPLSSAAWGASGMSSSDDSMMAVRRVARRVGRVDMATGVSGKIELREKGVSQMKDK